MLQHLGRLGLGAPQPRPDPGDQLLRLERLDHVVVRAGLQAEHDVDRVALRGQHHDRHARLGADRLADVDPVHAGQHQVEQHQVGLELAQRGQRTSTVGDHRGVEALPAQHDGQHLGQGGVVVHDQHACLHAQHRRTAGRAFAHRPSVRCRWWRCALGLRNRPEPLVPRAPPRPIWPVRPGLSAQRSPRQLVQAVRMAEASQMRASPTFRGSVIAGTGRSCLRGQVDLVRHRGVPAVPAQPLDADPPRRTASRRPASRTDRARLSSAATRGRRG